MSLEFEFRLQFPCGSLSTELSDFRQSARSGNKCKCKQTLKSTWKHVPRVMRSLLMSSPPISTSHRLFRCRYSNSRDVVAIYPFSSHPGELARRLPKIQRFDMSLTVKRFLTTFLKGSSYMYKLYMVQLERLFLPQLKLHMQSSFQNAKIFDCIGQPF